MHITRLLRYSLLFAVLFWSWVLIFAFFVRIPLPPSLFYTLHMPMLVILFFIVTMFFSRVQPTFLRGLMLGASFALTLFVLDLMSGMPLFFQHIAGGWNIGTAITHEIEYSPFSLQGLTLLTVVTALMAILPQTTQVARMMAPPSAHTY